MKRCHLLKNLIAALLLLVGTSAADVLDFTADSLSAERLGQYNVDISRSSVSGLSAGAYMADQFFVAYSGNMLGAGLFAGGPYGCSEGDLNLALMRCMNSLPFVGLDNAVLERLYSKAVYYADRGKIDPLDNLRSRKAFIFSGTLDTTVLPEVTSWAESWYRRAGMPAENIVLKNDLDVPHAIPTLDYGNPCSEPGKPWMNKCNYDGAGQALLQILGDLMPPRPAAELSGRFIKFRQNEFFGSGDLTDEELKNRYAMNEFGFAYVPEACSDGERCSVHVAFHGCKQVYNRNPDASDLSPDDASNPFGLRFVKFAGYNEWADTNNLIILYPQAQKVGGMNPRGCFDWWGYIPGTADLYATKQGPQMQAVYAMLERIADGLQPRCEGTNQPPVIALAGEAAIELDIGATLTLPNPEANASDPEDGDISGRITREPAGPLDTSEPGVHELRYNVEDSAGCKASEVVRTVTVRGCRQWTAANSVHFDAGRAESETCYWWFIPYKCYHATGSDDYLGVDSTVTTLRKQHPAVAFFEKAACP